MIEAYSHSLQIQERDGKTELYLANYDDYVPVYDITNPLIPIALGNARVPRGHVPPPPTVPQPSPPSSPTTICASPKGSTGLRCSTGCSAKS